MSSATLVYDGDCAFCSSCVRFIERYIPTDARIVPWQFAELDALGVTQQEAERAVQWIAADGTVSSGAAAIACLLSNAGGRWRPLGHLITRRPVLPLAEALYQLIARNRTRLPGGTPACALPKSRQQQQGKG